MIPSAALPGAPGGRGSWALHSSHSATPLRSMTEAANIAKSVTGWGSRFPSHSTRSRKRVNHLRLSSSDGFSEGRESPVSGSSLLVSVYLEVNHRQVLYKVFDMLVNSDRD